MSQSDYYLEQVERRKYEDDVGRWWIDDTAGDSCVDEMEGPYTEEEIDQILWGRALSGDFINLP